SRLVSLRVILNNVIDGWSLVSSSLKYHRTTLLPRLHLIDIEPHEFDNLLCNPLIKQVHTLLVDVTPSNLFNHLETEGVYLAKLSHLYIDCKNSISFHRTIALLSFVFGQLNHLSVKLVAIMKISSPLVISGDLIQQSCIDRLKPLATYNLNLELDVSNDLEEKIIFNSFFNVPFTNRQRPRVFIQERGNYYSGYKCNNIILPTYLFSRDLEKSSQMPINATDMFPRANELFLTDYREETFPWPLLTKISNDEGAIVTTTELESILLMAYNVHTLDIWEDKGINSSAILHNIDNLGTRIKTLVMDDITLTFENAERFCKLLSNQVPNLKVVFFNIYSSYDGWHWRSSRTVDAEHESTKCILNLIHFLVDHLQQLVSLCMKFNDFDRFEKPCIPDLIQQQLHQDPINRPYRLRCSTKPINIWLENYIQLI
ncbi:unnamed protein product, partial [Rotaria sp. Silwood2]